MQLIRCIRGLIEKFQDWFFKKLLKTIKTYSTLSPSKYSPWEAIHFSYCHFHCWKDPEKPSSGMLFSSSRDFSLISSVESNLCPFKVSWVLETGKSPQGLGLVSTGVGEWLSCNLLCNNRESAMQNGQVHLPPLGASAVALLKLFDMSLIRYCIPLPFLGWLVNDLIARNRSLWPHDHGQSKLMGVLNKDCLLTMPGHLWTSCATHDTTIDSDIHPQKSLATS